MGGFVDDQALSHLRRLRFQFHLRQIIGPLQIHNRADGDQEFLKLLIGPFSGLSMLSMSVWSDIIPPALRNHDGVMQTHAIPSCFFFFFLLSVQVSAIITLNQLLFIWSTVNYTYGIVICVRYCYQLPTFEHFSIRSA